VVFNEVGLCKGVDPLYWVDWKLSPSGSFVVAMNAKRFLPILTLSGSVGPKT